MSDVVDWQLIRRGSCYEDHVVGRVFEHHWGRTVQASDNILFTTQSMAFNPIYFNREAAVAAGYRDEVVNPMLVFSVVFGLSVEDLSEGGGPFLGATAVEFLRDVHPGDTLTASSTVVDARISTSRPDLGVVSWETVGRNAHGERVITFRRTNLVRRRGHGEEGVPPFEGYADDFETGARFRHARTRTITDLDLNGLTLLVMNTAVGHFSEQAMAGTSFGERINFGGLSLALTVGLATQDVTGQAVREVGLDDIVFPSPVMRGDTLTAGTEVLGVHPDGAHATVSLRHVGINQRGVVVCEATRRLQVRTRPTGSSADLVGRTHTVHDRK